MSSKFGAIFTLIFAVCAALSAQASDQKGTASSLSAVDAGCIVIQGTSDPYSHVDIKSPNPIILEMGSKGLPWKWINKFEKRDSMLKWPSKEGHTYQVWDAERFATNQLAIVMKELNHPAATPGRSINSLLSTLKYVQKLRAIKNSEALQDAETRLSNAIAAMLKIKINVEAGVGLKLWPSFTLPIGASIQSSNAGVKVRLAHILKPDNWQIISSASSSWTSIAPGKAYAARMQIRVPNQAVYYSGNYPIVAWYDVEYEHTRFRISNAADAEVVSAFDRTASIKSISDTEISLNIHLTSLLPIKNVKTELDLPDGWKGTASQDAFDINLSKDIKYIITKPAGENPALRIVGTIFRVGDYVTSKRVITDHILSLSSSASVPGLKLLQAAGEHAETSTISGRRCRQMPSTGHMYFDISDNFPPAGETYVTLEYANTSAGAMAIEYYNASGQLCHTPSQIADTSSTWQKLTFLLNDAKFDGSFPEGADVKVTYKGGTLGIAGIQISKFRVSVSTAQPTSGVSS